MNIRIEFRWRAPLVALTLALPSVMMLLATDVLPLPMYAARTGMECRSCHFDPNGGGPRNSLGYLFSKQRHDLAPDPDTTWADLPATNRIGDALFVGTNTRLLYVYEQLKGSSATQLSSFLQMQGTLNVTLQPHPSLTIVMVRDFGEFSRDITRDLYGLIQNPSARFYIKAGRIRPPFGLRQDDHESATRGGFLDTNAGGTGGFLPYDPREVMSGLEAGVFQGPLTMSAALLNGGVAFVNKAQTAVGKIVAGVPAGRIGVSIFDRFATSTRQRNTRWTGFALFHAPGLPDLTLLGETGFGTDDLGNGVKQNLVASFAEADYRLNRAVLLRAKYDYSDVYRSLDGSASERFLIETDLTLVPFADLKLSYRQIVPETTPDEHQLLGVVHFYF